MTQTTWIWLVGGLLLGVLGGWFALWSWRSYRETRRQVQAANVDPRSIPAVSLASPAAWIVLACGVGLTLVAWQLCYRRDLEHERFAFRTQATQLQALLRYRLEGYEAILRSAGGFAAGSLEAGNNDWRPFGQEWQAFVQSLRLPHAYPSVLGLGFHAYVVAGREQEHVGVVRASGLSDYAIFPTGSRAEYAPTLFFEPATEQNRKTIGYDLFSDPIAQEALVQARDTGRLVISRRMSLGPEVGRPSRPGFIMAYPVYGPLGLPGWSDGDVEALRGFVSLGFCLDDLLGSVLAHRPPGMELELQDQGPLIAGEATGTRSAKDLVATYSGGRARPTKLSQTGYLKIGRQTWTLIFRCTDEFDLAGHGSEAWTVLAGGLMVSGLLFGLLQVQGRARDFSQALVQRVTAELEERRRIEAEVRALSAELDTRVARRTAELAASHATLTETAARLRAIVEHEPEWVKTVSLDGRLLDMNPAGVSMIEAENLESVRGALVTELIHPQDRPAFQELYDRVGRGGRGSLQYRLITLRGQERWLESNAVPLRDAQGRIISVLSVTRDVTSRRAIEGALRALVAGSASAAAQEFFVVLVRSLAEAFGARYALVGQMPSPGAGKVQTLAVWANGARGDNFTYELAGTPCAEVIAKGLCVYPRQVAVQFPKDRLLSQLEIESYTGVPILDDQNRLLGIMVVLHDRPFAPSAEQRSILTIFAARAAAELNRARAENILRESEEQFRTLAEASPIGISRTDVAGRCIYNNRQWLEFTGQTLEESLGDGWAKAVHPEDRERTLRDWLQVARQGGEATDELRIRRPDGEVRWLRSRAKPIRDGSGRLLGHVGTHEDITDLKRAEAERASLEAQLRQAQKLEAIGTLAGGIAHDFNNILGAIMGFTHVAKLDAAGQPQIQESLDAILQSSRRARDLVTRILAFSRQEASRRRPVPVAPIVEEIAKLLRATLPATAAIQIRVAPELPLIEADPTQLHQVLMNLATNSAQALPEGRGRIEISAAPLTLDAQLAARHAELKPGSYLCLTVRDTGRGMDKETAERAFDPFFTTKGLGEGTGLGLSVVHGIVKSHHGALRLTTAVGQGTTFEVFLPAFAGQPDTVAAPGTSPSPGRGQRILLVDDEPALLSVGQRALLDLGYQVAAYSDPMEALTRFRSQPQEFDLLLTDLAMPQLSGTEFAREVRARRPSLPIVLTTGFGSSVTPETVRQLGICEILNKPAEVEELGAAVFRALHGQ
ncbi:MAG TPA: CHASE domain-containing protein [Verrucomicrobiae bacterium]|nr:CHASE domain-containing protein [Verrucomicrobiae bacterium]